MSPKHDLCLLKSIPGEQDDRGDGRRKSQQCNGGQVVNIGKLIP